MDTDFGLRSRNRKFIDLVKEREIKESTARQLARRICVTEDLVSRLGLEKELEGHTGCVNCLEWSESGDTLASTSDDLHIILWNPFTHKKLCSFRTDHTGNIFSVKFMPKSNKTIVASGAADSKVKVFNLSLSEKLYSCTCHTNRVKRLATVDESPSLIWSAGEDGLVLQHDLRTSHSCSSDQPPVFIDLADVVGHRTEAKCIAINARRPELVAIGADDPYVRMFDRRFIKLPVDRYDLYGYKGPWPGNCSSPEERKADEDAFFGTAKYFIAGHLRPMKEANLRNYAATYLTFSGDGTELLVNMRGEQVYLFDIIKRRRNRLFDAPMEQIEDDDVPHNHALWSAAYGNDNDSTKDYTLINTKILPDNIEEIKKQANNEFQLEKYPTATELYNEALGHCPTSAVLYGNRAAALMKRGWHGDVYAALRDCQACLLLDPGHVKARFRLARCLYDLGRLREAYRVIHDFEVTFPNYASNTARRSLRMDIIKQIERDPIPVPLYEDERRLAPHERAWRIRTNDYKLRYCGHCNTSTDIKEANFFGCDGQYIIAGSDDGNIFVWDRHTTNIVRILRGDTKIVNCLQPHPSTCLLATSGIDSVVRLWSPMPEDDKPNERHLTNHELIAKANQIRLYSDPFAVMVMDIIGPPRGRGPIDDDLADPQGPRIPQPQGCRPS